METLAEKIKSCDQHLKKGEIRQAREILLNLNPSQIPVRFRGALATLCRRSGLVNLGLKILTPKGLYDREHWLKTVSPSEAAEYGVLIQRHGSVRGSLSILKNIKPESFPEVLLFQSFCHVARWEHSEAVQLLEEYLQFPLNEYSKLVAEVNLASAQVGAGLYEDAERLLFRILRTTQSAGNNRLRANGFEILSRLYLHQEEWEKAEQQIAEAAIFLKGSPSVDSFLIRKAKALVTAKKTQDLHHLDNVYEEAVSRRDWESVRDLDFQRLSITWSEELFNKLYFGTPFKKYREKLLDAFSDVSPGKFYEYGSKELPLLDIRNGLLNGKLLTKKGGLVHRTLQIMTKDFYRDTSVADLFVQLYPDEYFDIFTSPSKVHQAVRQTKIALKKSGIINPEPFEENNGSYFLKTHDFRIRVSDDLEILDWYFIHLEKVQNKLRKNKALSASEIMELLNIKKSPYWRFMRWATENNYLVALGKGPSKRYILPADELKAA